MEDPVLKDTLVVVDVRQREEVRRHGAWARALSAAAPIMPCCTGRPLMACIGCIVILANPIKCTALLQVEVSQIPGSITAEEFEARKEEFKRKTVVCYCTVGYRSSAHAAKLAQQGFEAKNLEGGIVRWVSREARPAVFS
jgi:rhodanese-related sulfurtransferase